jgi:hypothetical protein
VKPHQLLTKRLAEDSEMSSKQAEYARPAEPEPRVPVVVLTQFLAALRARD